MAQPKNYAGKLAVRFTYSTNGQAIYGVDSQEGAEGYAKKTPVFCVAPATSATSLLEKRGDPLGQPTLRFSVGPNKQIAF